MTIELVPLCTATVSLADPILLPGAPFGSRVIGEVTAMEVEGERLKAHQRGAAAADWLVMSPDGTLGLVDVRVTLETEDGAVIFASYRGRLDLTTMTVYTAPLFETGDERYGWLNSIQAVAKGTFPEPGRLVYEMYELR